MKLMLTFILTVTCYTFVRAPNIHIYIDIHARIHIHIHIHIHLANCAWNSIKVLICPIKLIRSEPKVNLLMIFFGFLASILRNIIGQKIC